MAVSVQQDSFHDIVAELRRRSEKKDLDLVDVLSLSEAMVASMQNFFSSVDTKVYTEFRAIAGIIDKMKDEIVALQPDDLRTERLPRAGRELSAIVKHTEDATNTIMENAERILNADPSTDPEAYKALVDTAVTNIFEACTFQDITGQRINKVVQTLQHIEDRVLRIADAFGLDATAAPSAAASNDDDKETDKPPLDGPALGDEGIAQSDIDAMFD